MNTREERKIIITMSPVELRELADRMEKLWPHLRPTDPVFVDFLHYSSNFQVCLHLDQEYFYKLYKAVES